MYARCYFHKVDIWTGPLDPLSQWLAYLRLTVLLAEVACISSPPLNGCEAAKLAVKVPKDRKYTQPFSRR